MAFSSTRFILCVVVLLVPQMHAKKNDMCSITESQDFSGMINVVCNCMQTLKEWSSPIHELTINQMGCTNPGLELSWSALETVVKPQVVTVIGSELYFYQDPSEDQWPSSIRELRIIRSRLEALPKNALTGLDLLEEFTIFDTEVLRIEEDAVSNLEKLRVVEIANATLGIVKPSAFNNLPAINDLAIIFSDITSIEPNAINKVGPQYPSMMMDCTTFGGDASGRSMSLSTMGILGDIMGRHLSTAPDLNLPEYGSRFLLYKNNITHLKTSAVRECGFGFLILGGNRIGDLHSEALDTELYNECEISAALIIENRMERVHSLALSKIRGREGAPESTFIAMSNNTFREVEKRGFQLASNLVIFTIEENRFFCTCDGFDWVLSEEGSSAHRNLEKDLIVKGKCVDGLSIISFTTTCTDGGNPTTIPPSTVVTQDTRRPFTPRPPFSTVDPNGAGVASSDPFASMAAFFVLVVARWLL